MHLSFFRKHVFDKSIIFFEKSKEIVLSVLATRQVFGGQHVQLAREKGRFWGVFGGNVFPSTCDSFIFFPRVLIRDDT